MKRKKWILIAAIVIFAAAWLALAASIALGLDVRIRTGAVIAAAIASEGLIWCAAGVLGLSIFEARQRIWRALARPFSRR